MLAANYLFRTKNSWCYFLCITWLSARENTFCVKWNWTADAWPMVLPNPNSIKNNKCFQLVSGQIRPFHIQADWLKLIFYSLPNTFSTIQLFRLSISRWFYVMQSWPQENYDQAAIQHMCIVVVWWLIFHPEFNKN